MSRFAILAVLAACAPASRPRAPAHPPPSAAGARLALAEIKLDLGRDRILMVHGDGSVELGGFRGLRVTEDGRIVGPGGDTILALQADGSIHGRDGARIERLHLDTDGLLTNAGQKIEIDRNGMLRGIRAPGARIDGATDAYLRRTALLVLVAATIDGSRSAPDDLLTNTVALPVAGCSFAGPTVSATLEARHGSDMPGHSSHVP